MQKHRTANITKSTIAKAKIALLRDNEKVKSVLESYKNLECPKTLKKEYVIDYL